MSLSCREIVISLTVTLLKVLNFYNHERPMSFENKEVTGGHQS